MNTISLVKHFNTQFFAAHYVGNLSLFLKENISNVIDIAHARLVRDCMNVLQNCSNKLIDSEDNDRNKLLQLNEQIRQQPDYSTKKLPVFNYPREQIGDYQTTLNPDTVYKIDSSNIPLAVLLQLCRPDLQFDFAAMYPHMFRYVMIALFPTDIKWTSFNVLLGSNYYRVDADCDFKFKTLTAGVPLSQDELIGRHLALPTEFGSCILKDNSAWRPVLDTTINDIIVIRGNRKRMIDFVKECATYD
jgi:hypothetical protein